MPFVIADFSSFVKFRLADFDALSKSDDVSKGAVEIIHRADLGDSGKLENHRKVYEERFANPFVAAEKGFIDEVIMPRNTRRRIARAFASLRNKNYQTH